MPKLAMKIKKEPSITYPVNGFSLLELLGSLSILTILLSTAIPHLISYTDNAELRTRMNHYKKLIQLARIEAISHSSYGVICHSDDGKECSNTKAWTRYLIIFADLNKNRKLDSQINEQPAYIHKIILNGNSHLFSSRSTPITFNEMGSSIFSNTTVSLCKTNIGMAIKVSNSGRIMTIEDKDGDLVADRTNDKMKCQYSN